MNTILYVYPGLVTWCAVVLCFVFSYQVGQARTKHGVRPPFMDGPEEFLVRYRIHQNTVEALIVFLPALWLFAMFQSPVWAGILGLVWLVGRVVYAVGYAQEWKKRMPGFLICVIVTALLLLGALIGLLGAAFTT